MRLSSFILVLLLPIFAGCKLLPPSDGLSGPDAATAASAEIAVDGTQTPATNTGIRPKPRPGSVTVQEPATIEPVPVVAKPEVRISKEQALCEKQGGNWGNAGESTGKTCIKRTRDGGKQCRKESDCDSLCLARSGTCAPVKPLFGCNEILQDDGRRVTLCVN